MSIRTILRLLEREPSLNFLPSSIFVVIVVNPRSPLLFSDSKAYEQHGREDIEEKMKALLTKLKEKHPDATKSIPDKGDDLNSVLNSFLQLMKLEDPEETKQEFEGQNEIDYADFRSPSKVESDASDNNKLVLLARMFNHFSSTDDFKIPGTAYYGGFEVKDME